MSLPNPDANATVLITGASSGIGTELARQLAARGHNVTLVARRKARLQEVAEEVRRAHGVAAEVHACNLASDRARANLITKLSEGKLRIDAVCNNAGFGTFGKFQDLPLEREAEEVHLNVVALHELSGAFLDGMIKRQAGAILNVASIAGFQPLPSQATYGATKAFAVSFSEALHTDLNGTGVSCTALCPGPVRTEFVEVANMSQFENMGPDFVWKTPAEVARVGIEGMVKGKRIVFSGLAHAAVAASGRFAPRSVLLPLASRFGLDRF
jgi:short-subunit dehydrogenase